MPLRRWLRFASGEYRSLVKTGRLELRCATAEFLPYSTGFFSKACTVNSLFYWTDAPHGLKEIHRVLEGGGKLVLCVTSKQSLENKRFASHGLELYEDDELCRMMEGAGFEIVEMSQASDRHREFVCIVGVKRFLPSPMLIGEIEIECQLKLLPQ